MKLSRDFVLKLKIDNGHDGKPCDVMNVHPRATSYLC